MGIWVFSGAHQTGTLSFVPDGDCEECARFLAQNAIAVRAGLHCAPLAHESAGTLQTGTVRISYGHDANLWQTEQLIRRISAFCMQKNCE
jgi:selenocysteine lyase/cysteine desulfurase